MYPFNWELSSLLIFVSRGVPIYVLSLTGPLTTPLCFDSLLSFAGAPPLGLKYSNIRLYFGTPFLLKMLLQPVPPRRKLVSTGDPTLSIATSVSFSRSLFAFILSKFFFFLSSLPFLLPSLPPPSRCLFVMCIRVYTSCVCLQTVVSRVMCTGCLMPKESRKIDLQIIS